MVVTALSIVLVIIFGFFALIAAMIWMFRDQLVWAWEVVAYGLLAAGKLALQATAALLEWLDELLLDLEIADEPLARALVMALVGLLVGVAAAMLLAMVRNQPWVIVTFIVSVLVGIVLGLLADPEADWSLGAFPRFPSRGGREGPQLPLNL